MKLLKENVREALLSLGRGFYLLKKAKRVLNIKEKR